MLFTIPVEYSLKVGGRCRLQRPTFNLMPRQIAMRLDLFDNSGYNPGNMVVRMLWVVASGLFFKLGSLAFGVGRTAAGVWSTHRQRRGHQAACDH